MSTSCVQIYRTAISTFNRAGFRFSDRASYLYRWHGNSGVLVGRWVGMQAQNLPALEEAQLVSRVDFCAQYGDLVVTDDFDAGFQATHIVIASGHAEAVCLDDETGILWTQAEWRMTPPPVVHRWQYDPDTEQVTAPDLSIAETIALRAIDPPVKKERSHVQ